jgi:hypothetical protein
MTASPRQVAKKGAASFVAEVTDFILRLFPFGILALVRFRCLAAKRFNSLEHALNPVTKA